MSSFIVLFQYVDPRLHPEHYCPACGDHPIRLPDEVPQEHWSMHSVVHPDHASAVAQYRGLKELIRQGEFVRAVSLRKVGGQ